MDIPVKLTKYLDTFSNLLLVRAISNGLMLMMPIMMVGSLAVMVNNLPIDHFQGAMLGLFGERWKNLGGLVAQGTFSIMSVVVLLSVSYSITQENRLSLEGRTHPLIGSAVALASLIILTEPTGDSLGLPFFWLSNTGLFVAIITAVTATYTYICLSSYSALRVDVFSHEADSNLYKAITAIIPTLLTLVLFAVVKMYFTHLGYPDIHKIVYDVLKSFFIDLQNNMGTALLFNISSHIFWFFGIHGNNILEPVSQELYMNALAANIANVEMHLPPTEIFTKPFFDVFVYLGGSGSSLSLIAAILIGARRTNIAKIANISIFPALFNINEVIVFGLPIVFNPYYLLPFLTVPCILTATTYLAMVGGGVPLTQAAATLTTPILLGGYTASHSYAASLLQLVNLAIGTAIYLPFVRMSEAQRTVRAKAALLNFYQEVYDLEERKVPVLMNREDATGSLSRGLAEDIRLDLADDIFVMEYQPQINNDGQVSGAEALLRWPHRIYGRIPPPVAVAVAEEAGLMEDLGDMIIKKVFKQVGQWQQLGHMKDLVIALNISASQMEKSSIVSALKLAILQNSVNPHGIEIELTEGRLLSNSADTWGRLEQFRALGFKFAIDDFGMGHNSMRYLREFKVDTIKLDGSLTTEVLTDKNARDIVSSIVQLANNLDLNIIAEFVETKDQMLLLKELGCKQYQGYYYSASLTPEEFANYVYQMNVKGKK